jgi:hypothetical protein
MIHKRDQINKVIDEINYIQNNSSNFNKIMTDE